MSTKGKRYSNDEKQEVIDFVNNYNAERGRGGVANASKKFAITQMTINSWLKRDSSNAVVNLSKAGNVYQKLGALHELIQQKEKELETLKKDFDSLKEQADL